MFKKYSLMTLSIIFAFSFILLGCSSEDESEQSEQWKATLIAAMNKHSEIETYTFSGEAALQLDWPALTGQVQDPLTSSLTSILTNGKIAWQGVADEQAPRVEVDLTFTPNDFQAQFEVPALLNNNKLYIQIPLLATVEDEYLTYDLEQNLANVSFMTMMRYLAEAVDESYFELVENEASDERTIAFQIDKQNIEDIVSNLDIQLPAIVNDFEQQGIISAEQANDWREQLAHSSPLHITPEQIDQPGMASFTINEAGFIVSQSFHMYFANQAIEMTQQLDHINEAVTFNKPMPEHTRSIFDMLNMFQ